ncbi:hypothetical protein AAG906_015930 [Vitis piasezkii]
MYEFLHSIDRLPMLKSLDLSQNSIKHGFEPFLLRNYNKSATYASFELVMINKEEKKLKDPCPHQITYENQNPLPTIKIKTLEPNLSTSCMIPSLLQIIVSRGTKCTFNRIRILSDDASNNCITSLPEDLAHCLKLIKLDVEGNKLTMLSENMIASWVLLTELNASRNLLTGLPENIGRLSRLIRLDFHQNRISSIPASIKGCCSLAEFYMGPTLPTRRGMRLRKLKEYPVEACKLRLQGLDLSNNSLSGLPPEIGMMTTLRKLVLTGNPLRTLRSSLVSGPTPALLKFLRSRLSTDEDSEAATTAKENVVTMAARLSITSKELSLEGMGLSAVPAQVWESSEIVKVDLSRNSIQELPPNLPHALILSRNKIQEWPGVILKSLPNLSCLKLDNNPLRQIPADGFQAVSKLQILDLSGNSASLPDNPAFSSLPQLQELYLRRMQLCEVPSDILSLQQLQILDLSQNSLQLIPEVSCLQCINRPGNYNCFWVVIGLLEPSLQALRLDGNPLRSIRRTILDRGTKAVLKYLKEKIPEH